VSAGSLISLAALGAVATHAEGVGRVRWALRVTFCSALALALTAIVGHLFGATA
jgi:vacuolar iron transporter family protein